MSDVCLWSHLDDKMNLNAVIFLKCLNYFLCNILLISGLWQQLAATDLSGFEATVFAVTNHTSMRYTWRNVISLIQKSHYSLWRRGRRVDSIWLLSNVVWVYYRWHNYRVRGEGAKNRVSSNRLNSVCGSETPTTTIISLSTALAPPAPTSPSSLSLPPGSDVLEGRAEAPIKPAVNGSNPVINGCVLQTRVRACCSLGSIWWDGYWHARAHSQMK